MKWLQATARNVFHGVNESRDGFDTIIEGVFMCSSHTYGVLGSERTIETVRMCMTIDQAESLLTALQEWIKDAKDEHEKIEVVTE